MTLSITDSSWLTNVFNPLWLLSLEIHRLVFLLPCVMLRHLIVSLKSMTGLVTQANQAHFFVAFA